MSEPVSRRLRHAVLVLALAPLWLLLLPIFLAHDVGQWWSVNPVRQLRKAQRSRYLLQDRDAE